MDLQEGKEEEEEEEEEEGGDVVVVEVTRWIICMENSLPNWWRGIGYAKSDMGYGLGVFISKYYI